MGNYLRHSQLHKLAVRGYSAQLTGATDNGERIGFDKLAKEAYVRFNWLRLIRSEQHCIAQRGTNLSVYMRVMCA